MGVGRQPERQSIGFRGPTNEFSKEASWPITLRGQIEYWFGASARYGLALSLWGRSMGGCEGFLRWARGWPLPSPREA